MSRKKDLGMKRVCIAKNCGCRFYDMEQESPVCPQCGTVAIISQSVAHARRRALAELEEISEDDSSLVVLEVEDVAESDPNEVVVGILEEFPVEGSTSKLIGVEDVVAEEGELVEELVADVDLKDADDEIEEEEIGSD